ncbi:PGAP1-like alpha/beta domain-containing protein [Shewanella marina]|uniref:PGAP1-like alpha/beta domain-containing protein n=1 Tax=Shewanella marina TaxID=487319 RepID=UPI00046F255B|nr:alpha/beta hydrolase [Shewanella marina]
MSATQKVIILHGLYMSGLVMWPLAKYIERQGFEVLNLSYNTLNPNKEQIFATIDAFIDEQPSVFVCHSMGGLVARAYLEADSHQSQFINKVITLGTPHQGSNIAKQIQERGLQRLLNNSVDYLLPYHQTWPFAAKLYSIAGDFALGIMPLIHKDSASDGTVLLNETKLTGMTQHKVFHLSHTALIYSKQVMRYVVQILRDEQ